MTTDSIQREDLLEGLRQTTGAKSTAEIAREMGIPWRQVVTFRAIADVRPAFCGPGGQAFFAPDDVARIKAAAECHGPIREKRVDESEELPPPAADLNALVEKASRMAQGIYE